MNTARIGTTYKTENTLLNYSEMLDAESENILKEFASISQFLRTDIEEAATLIEFGFGYKSSIKDLYNFILNSSIRNFFEAYIGTRMQTGFDMVMPEIIRILKSEEDEFLVNAAKFALKSSLHILKNWSNFNDLIIGAKTNFTDYSKEDFETAKKVYYDIQTYFHQQASKHIGEQLVRHEKINGTEQLKQFVKKHKLRQREFNYSLDPSTMAFMIQSAVKFYKIKQNERELVELSNLIFIYCLHNKAHAYQLSNLLNMLAQAFPDLADHFDSIIMNAQNYDFKDGDVIIEVSPPLAEYDFQTELMLRIYKKNGDNFQITQYSLPHAEGEAELIIESMRKHELNVLDAPTMQSKDPSNTVLSNIIMADGRIPLENLVSAIPTVKRIGGIKTIRENDAIINPIIKNHMASIQIFMDGVIRELPEIRNDPVKFSSMVQQYSEVIGIATANNKDNPEIARVLDNGTLLKTAAMGGNTAAVVNAATNGKGTTIKSSGYCGRSSVNIGGTSDAKATAQVNSLFNGKNNIEVRNVKIVDGKGGKLTFFEKFNKETRETEKHVVCPNCGKGSVDVCNSNSICSNKDCGKTSGELYEAYNIKAQEQELNSLGIGGAIAGIFEALFGFLNF